VLFKIFVEKLAGDLNGKDFVFQLKWDDRLKPRIEPLVAYTSLYVKKTVVPYFIMLRMHEVKSQIVICLIVLKKGYQS